MARAAMLALMSTWIEVGGGWLAVGPRPGRKRLAALAGEGCTDVLTLLSEREGAAELAESVRARGMAWATIPLANGVPPASDRDDEIVRGLARAATVLARGGRLYVHCAAGIHRTGMIAYALLRALGLSRADAHRELVRARALTGDGVGEHRLAWAERFARDVASPLAPR